MVSRIEPADNDDRALVAAKSSDAPASARSPSGSLPGVLQFPLLVLLSLTLSSLLYSFAAALGSASGYGVGVGGGDLASVSRRLDQWWEVGALVGWRTVELGLGWIGGYDGYDLASLTVLCHGPPLYLLSQFYQIQPVTVLSSLLIDCLTTYIPFRLLRPLSPAHAVSASSPAVQIPNSEIVTDYSIQTTTTLLGASIYSLVLYSASASRLPVYLATYFADIPSVAAAHSATPVSLLPLTLLFGLAAKSFIFTPAAAVTTTTSAGPAFDPVAATLSETFWYNIWGAYSPRVKVIIQRTATLVLVCSVNTFVQSYVTIEGVEAEGAVIYSGIWAAAAGITGLALGLVGAV